MKKLFIAVLTLSVIALGIFTILPYQTGTQPASAQQSDKYDGDCTGNETQGRCADKPLLCQYPDRWSNPVGGCDNSDPAVPECIKAFSTQQGEQDCIDAFVQANDPTPVMEGK